MSATFGDLDYAPWLNGFLDRLGDDDSETRTAAEVSGYTGFDRYALLPFLSFEEARPWLKVDASPANWPEPKRRTRRNALLEVEEYMRTYGLRKAIDHRGLSAGRTITKLRAWCWLAGDAEAVRICDDVPYPQYGAPKLRALCRHFGLRYELLLDFEDLEVFEAQAEGRVCPGCRAGDSSGCGL